MGSVVWFHVVKKRDNPFAFLAAFGFVMPLSLLIPFKLLPFLDIRNTVLLVPIGVSAPLIVLRCLEGMWFDQIERIVAIGLKFMIFSF